jgi:hypothetical protein
MPCDSDRYFQLVSSEYEAMHIQARRVPGDPFDLGTYRPVQSS